MFPIYVKPENKELSDSLDKIKTLVYEIEKETAFLSTTQPTLIAVPAPCNDIVCVGDVYVCGMSNLSPDRREALVAMLQSFFN